jgi:Cyclic nucleotide-binding domain
VRIESAVTSVTWLPVEALEGIPNVPLELAIAHYDEPPPEVLRDLDGLRREDAFREANELRAWIRVEGGRISGHGYSGRGVAGFPRFELGPYQIAFPGIELPVLQTRPEVGDGWIRFVQTAGGKMGVPAPRRVEGQDYFHVGSMLAWTTLQLVLHADGRAEGSLVACSPFPAHWVYGADGRLTEKRGLTSLADWYGEALGADTPWGGLDSAEVEEAVEQELARTLLRSGERMPRRRLEPGETLVRQGEEGTEMFLLLGGRLAVEIDGETVAELGVGALVGEMALLEGGRRSATLRAASFCRVALVPPGCLSEERLAELAETRRQTPQGTG